jgi:hypothetical protein
MGFFIFCFALVGCKLNIQPGHYQGTWSSQNQVQVVDIEVVKESKKKGSLGRITGLNGEVLIDLYLAKKKRNHIQLTIPRYDHQVLDLLKRDEPKDPLKNQECYAASFPVIAELCWDNHDFQLTLRSDDPSRSFTLSAGTFLQSETKPWEPERDFTLSEMIKLLSSQNSDIKIELERLYRARQTAAFSYLNLLPHVRFSTGTAIASLAVLMSPFGMVNEAGNLTPFLLPDRWIQAVGSHWAVLAQREGFRAGRANVIFQLEGLVYTLLSQERIELLYDQLIQDAELILSQVELLENQNRIQKGSSDTIRTLLFQLYFQRKPVISSLRESKASLSEILGIRNPHGIRNITLDHEYHPQDSVQRLNEQKFKDAVLYRAPELLQMKHLITYSKIESAQLFFLWFDPATIPSMTLGFNLIPQYANARSNVRELEIKNKLIETQLTNKSVLIVGKYNSILKDFDKLESFIELEDRRLQEVKDTLLLALSPDSKTQFQNYKALEMKEIIQDALSAKILLESCLTAFQIARSQLNRLLLIGYQHFLNSENEGDELLSIFSEDVKVGNPRLE